MSRRYDPPRSPSRSARSLDYSGHQDLLSSSPRRRNKTTIFSDRYIPTRTGVDLQAAFLLSNNEDFPNLSKRRTLENEIEIRKEEEANKTFSTILKAELFGDNLPAVATDKLRLRQKELEDRNNTHHTSNNPIVNVNNPFNSSNSISSSGQVSGAGGVSGSSSVGTIGTITSSSVISSTSSLPGASGSVTTSGNGSDIGTNSTITGVINNNGSTDSTTISGANNGGSRGSVGPNLVSSSSTLTGDLHSVLQSSASPTNMNSDITSTPRQSVKLFTFQLPNKSRPISRDLQNELYSLSPVRPDSQKLLLSPQKKTRNILKVPYRVLDAPELSDDFYLNLVDWGSQDVLAVGLSDSIYLWDGATQLVDRLCNLPNKDKVTSLNWIGSGTHLAIGTLKGLVEIWDATKLKCIRTMLGHLLRVSSLAWNEHILSSGLRDRTILNRDVRIPEHYVNKFETHKQEVCGLKWNVEENKLASGGNDNKIYIWDGLNPEPLHQFNDHIAAVKAIAWSPHQRGILASGGGTADKTIKTWNTLTGTLQNNVYTGSQVCNLIWLKNSNEIVSTHGFSRNQVVVWKYPSMQQIALLTGHTYRVLYLSLSPDGETIVTGAGDETLRFWNVFEKNRNDDPPSSVLLDAFSRLR